MVLHPLVLAAEEPHRRRNLKALLRPRPTTTTMTAPAATSIPSPAAQLILSCLHNALRMGAPTQLALCPPRLRRRVQQEWRSRSLVQTLPVSIVSPTQLSDYDAAHQEILRTLPRYDDEESSSGDDDESSTTCEPLVPPLPPPEPTSPTGAAPAFSRRKLRFLDAIGPLESRQAREYVSSVLQRNNKVQEWARQLQRAQQGKNNPAHDDDDDEMDTTTDEPDIIKIPMTLALAAALVVESLQGCRKESMEGMSLCYDGIVNAGVTLVDDNRRHEEILEHLEPLLITSLTPTAGEVWLTLASLRDLCGTVRYKRRLVQRIAPLLVRPPHAAVWCLQHQQDMEAIVACTELILDRASQLFARGWYEKGRLAASAKRDTAAQQLRTLSTDKHHGLLKHKEQLLEDWEVVAVVSQIKLSLKSAVALTDWTKVTAPADAPKPAFRRRRNTLQTATSIDSSPRAPRSPARPFLAPAPEIMENVFGPSFASSSAEMDNNSRTHSSPPRIRPLEIESPAVTPPPRSPKSPTKDLFRTAETATTPQPPMSPKRTKPAAVFSPSNTTPQSPSASSVGTSGSLEMISYRPQSSSSSSPLPVTNYRLLTSTAAERKQMVAACRALRAQIQRFEDAYIQVHGRAPKRNAERAPLATTYAQYREWKRAIRADAAFRIQALMRGAHCRSMLLRSNNMKLTRVVLKRPAQEGYDGSNSTLNRISLPVEIGNQDSDSSYAGSATGEQQPYSGSLAPQWANSVLRRRGSDGDRAPEMSPRGAAATPPALPQGPALDDLQKEKRDLKRRLKQYDINFARQNGRMPVKAEKEPIRHLYEEYNTLKSRIIQLEREAGSRITASPPTAIAVDPRPERRPLETPGASLSSIAYSRRLNESNSDNSSNEDSPVRSTRNNSRRIPRDSSSPRPEAAQDLTQLRAEKSELHHMLRQYEREFYNEQGRQVSSFSDIRPVANQYRRYKEIKRAIAALQER